MTFQQIWAVLFQLMGHLKIAGDWKASKDGKAVGPVTAVSFTPTDLAMTVTDDDGKALLLEAKPGNPAHADVFANGAKQDSARLVVSVKSQFPFKPLIVVLTFKHVTVGSAIHDYRFDNPK